MKLDNKHGMTLIEILIVIAIIGILASVGIAYYRNQYLVKARLFEVTNSMSYVASSVSKYYNENYVFPTAVNIPAIQDSLGVSVPAGRISSLAVAGGAASGINFFKIKIITSYNGV